VEAWTAEGAVLVLSGSQMPRVGLRARCAIPVLAFWETKSLTDISVQTTQKGKRTANNIAVPVVSLPVPAVLIPFVSLRYALE